MIILAAIFLFSGGTVAVVQHQYQQSKRKYRAASAEFTSAQPQPAAAAAGSENADGVEWDEEEIPIGDVAPVKVNFETLLKINPEITGWLICPDTVIDYPVMDGATNDSYINRAYDGSYNLAGSIFVDERNHWGFSDPITILYGHHMASGAMFAILDHWQNGQFFSNHPIMWLLTPTQDYRVELFSAFNTSAYSDIYNIYYNWGEDFSSYLWQMAGYSAVRSTVQLDMNAHYIVMSTCAYVFDDARSVLYGKLVPLDSAGGVPFRTMKASEMQEAGMTLPDSSADSGA